MKLRHLLTLVCLFILTSSTLNAQLKQTIRGSVTDLESKYPLIGVNVILKDDNGGMMGSISDEMGNFQLEEVPVGRHNIEFSYLGYELFLINNVIVNSAKETILNIEMEETSTQLTTVEILAKRSGDVINEMAFVSAREFSVEETDRYAGSRGDPARMASNFAGVLGADDSRNDIIVRGNTPQGVLWRLDGVSIPNPNHFAIPGTGGGPVSILNNKFLSNSDFFTGAFPAEFGNGIAGAFDLKMRNGNNNRYELSAQLGFLGTELMAEGPISRKNRSSFLAMYRYSTLNLFSFMGINVGTTSIPRYQDAAVRLNFPLKNGGHIALFGIGGISDVDLVISDEEEPNTETLIYGSNDRDQYFGTNLGIVGLSLTQPLNPSTFVKATLAASHARVDADHDYIYRHVEEGKYVVDDLPQILDYSFTDNKYSAYIFVNHKISGKTSMKAGLNTDWYQMRHIDSARFVKIDPNDIVDPTIDPWRVRWDADDGALMLQPYIQFKYKASPRLTMTGGLTSLYFGINKESFSPVEPRLGASYDLGNKQRLSAGIGYHSQMWPTYIYYYSLESNGKDPIEHNLDNIGLTKSFHSVLGYEKAFKSNMRMKAETYFQYLHNIPVKTVSSPYALINSGSGFSRFFPDELENSGIGRNIGIELTVERFFTRGYYFLLTGSLFDSRYQGSDEIWRNTSFNGHYGVNGLFAKEFTFKNGSAFNVGGKVTFAGGRRYGDVDIDKSFEAQDVVYEENENYNEYQFDPYFRADLRLNYKMNRPKVTHEFSVDIVNLFNIKNILTLSYAPDHPSGKDFVEEYQIGLLPIFYYKLDFRL